MPANLMKRENLPAVGLLRTGFAVVAQDISWCSVENSLRNIKAQQIRTEK